MAKQGMRRPSHKASQGQKSNKRNKLSKNDVSPVPLNPRKSQSIR